MCSSLTGWDAQQSAELSIGALYSVDYQFSSLSQSVSFQLGGSEDSLKMSGDQDLGLEKSKCYF